MDISKCTSCSHEVKGLSRVCPLCNGGMKLVVKDGPRTCPRCSIPLTIHQYNHHDLDTCPDCEGMWIEPETFRVLTTEYDVYRDDTVDPKYYRPGQHKSEGYLPCACCSKLMIRKNYKAISGVMIDLCVNCGVWLDKDELAQIRSFIASGGLDRAQDRDIEKQGQSLRELDNRVSDLEYMDKMLNRFNARHWLYKYLR